MTLKYRQSVLAQLARHGVQPFDDTPPELVHDFLNDLYRYEIRGLRQRLKKGEIPKSDYALRVDRVEDALSGALAAAAILGRGVGSILFVSIRVIRDIRG